MALNRIMARLKNDPGTDTDRWSYSEQAVDDGADPPLSLGTKRTATFNRHLRLVDIPNNAVAAQLSMERGVHLLYRQGRKNGGLLRVAKTNPRLGELRALISRVKAAQAAVDDTAGQASRAEQCDGWMVLPDGASLP